MRSALYDVDQYHYITERASTLHITNVETSIRRVDISDSNQDDGHEPPQELRAYHTCEEYRHGEDCFFLVLQRGRKHRNSTDGETHCDCQRQLQRCRSPVLCRKGRDMEEAIGTGNP